MRILVSGSTGLVGTALVEQLRAGGYQIVRLVRASGSSDNDVIVWDPVAGTIEREKLENLDAIVHLAGENIAAHRWSEAQKARIRDSRVEGTGRLCQAIAELERPPSVFVCASAIGFYGDRGEELLDEASNLGRDFLSIVCREWEAACEPAVQAGIRVVNLRIGVVLTPAGGALRQMLRPFRFCCGGVVGSGQQVWSWIAIDDLLRAIEHTITTVDLSGPVNAVSPNPVTNREFTQTLGRVLHRPTIMPLPAFLARLLLGEMANELLLASTRVVPKRLIESGFNFQYPDLEAALRHVLGR